PYHLSLHDALPISVLPAGAGHVPHPGGADDGALGRRLPGPRPAGGALDDHARSAVDGARRLRLAGRRPAVAVTTHGPGDVRAAPACAVFLVRSLQCVDVGAAVVWCT